MSAIHPSKSSGENTSRAQSPLALVESPSKANITSTTKSWCSSPFSNLDALSPEGNSLSFSLADFSPTISFSSPRLKFQEQPSPQSSSCRQKDHYSSIFSPSIFSPFNKSLKPHKIDKLIDGDYLDTDLPHCSPSKAILPSPDDSSHTLLNSIGYRGFGTSDIPGVHFGVNARCLKVDDDDVDVDDQPTFDDSVLGDDIALRLGDSPAATKGGGLLGLIHSNGSRGRRSQASQSATQVSPNTRPVLSGDSPGSSSSSDQQKGAQGIKGNTPLPPPPNPTPNSSSALARHQTSLAACTPARKNVPFSSPAVLAKAKQSNISPTVARGTCNCKKSKCLKLYCECFAALRYCDSCNCVECNNCKEHEDLRQEAIQVTKERNPSAFQLKVSVKKGHMAGCNCKKSQCLKKYCECFEGSVFCGANCKCKSCENYAGSEKLKEAKPIVCEKRERLLTRPGEEAGTTTTFVKPAGPLSVVPTAAGAIVPPSPLSTSSAASSGIAAPSSSSSGVSTVSTPFKVRSRRYPSPLSSSVYGSGSKDGSSGSRGCHISSLSTEGPSMVGGGVQWALGDCSSATSSPSSSNTSHSPGRSVETSTDDSGSCGNGIPPLKKRRVDVQQPVAEYPFFGPMCPRMAKLTTLQCLEFLDGPNLFAVSLVSRLLNQAAMDDALWE